MTYLALFLLALCLARVQYMVTKFNMGARWNGYGAIDGVLDKKSDAPMVYRVLVPWLVGRKKSIWKYELWQTIFMFMVVSSLFTAWNGSTALIAMIGLTATFWYDYWDWTIEITGLTLALVSFPLSLLVAVPFGLSRETAPLIGLVYALHSGDWIRGAILSGVAMIGIVLVRFIQGTDHPLYCERWMIRTNVLLLQKWDLKAWASVLLCALALVGAWGRAEFVIVPILTVAGFVMAKANETRVFVGVVPYAALLLARWL